MKEEKIFFENSKGIKLCGVLSNPTEDKQRPIIILCHGFCTSKKSTTCIRLEEILNESEFSSFRIDLFGHGESEGKFENITISEAVDDILSTINFLKQKCYTKIGLQGSSFGGLASILVASKSNDLFVLTLKCPVSDYYQLLIDKYSSEDIKKWKEDGFTTYETIDKKQKLKLNYSFYEDAMKIDCYEAAKKIKIPTLIVHGDQDESVKVEQSKKTVQTIPNCKLEIIEGADHRYTTPEHFEKMLALISDFIIEKSRGLNEA